MNHLSYISIAVLVIISAVNGKPYNDMDFSQKKGLGCGGKPADVFFLLDSSSSIWSVDFQKLLSFVSQAVDMFTIGESDTRVGVATFSSQYHPQFHLDSYQDKDQLKAAIARIPYQYGDTYTGTALRYMREKEFAPEVVREGVSKIAIVVTDGASRYPEVTKEQARLAKLEGIHVFALGIGHRYKLEELREIASEPAEKFVYEAASFDTLDSLKAELALGDCTPEEMQADQPPVCSRDTESDVMFVFDSASMGGKKISMVQEYIGNVVQEFNLEDDVMRAGVISRNCHHDDIELGEYSNDEEFAKELRDRDYPELSHVIKKMRTQIYKEEYGAREGAMKKAVVFVDGKLDVPKRVFEEIDEAKRNDIEIFVVAIGDVDTKQVELIATSPEHVTFVPEYDMLGDYTSPMVDIICSGLE